MFLCYNIEDRGNRILYTLYLSEKNQQNSSLFSDDINILGSIIIPPSERESIEHGLKQFADGYASKNEARSPIKISG